MVVIPVEKTNIADSKKSTIFNKDSYIDSFDVGPPYSSQENVMIETLRGFKLQFARKVLQEWPPSNT